VHAEGEPGRVVVGGSGMPEVPGTSMREKREYLQRERDDIRLLLLREPRGYPAQNVNFVFASSVADHGFVIAEQGGVYPGMSGHNCMCVATALVERGLVRSSGGEARFTLEAPAGVVDVQAQVDGGGKVRRVSLELGTAYVERLDVKVKAPCIENVDFVLVDLVYGSGMTYAVVDASGLVELAPSRGREIVRLGEMLKCRTREVAGWTHPVTGEPGPEILVFRGPSTRREQRDDGRVVVVAENTVVMSNGGDCDWARPESFTGMLDRSPCGTGTCAVMALLHARGELRVNDTFIHTSIVGTTFEGTVLSDGLVGQDRRGIKPRLSGRAWVTAHATIVLDADDPFPTGLPEVRDIW